MLDLQFGAAKVNKYASRESGDTVELVERPTSPGGFSLILADGQGSGRNAKTLSNLVTGKCAALLKEGVRDGVVARAANDYLFAYRHGQVSATLNIITADFTTRSLVITRNNPEPTFLIELKPSQAQENPEREIEITPLSEISHPIGIYPRTRPVIKEYELKPGLVIVAFSDGISKAGEGYQEKIDLARELEKIICATRGNLAAQKIASKLLELAIGKDRGRPQDDMSVIVVTTAEFDAEDGIPLPRKLAVQVPFQ